MGPATFRRGPHSYCIDLLSADLRGQLGLEGLLDFGHGGLNLFVVEGLVLVLQDEADGVGLEAFGDALALIDVEEADALEQLLDAGWRPPC